MIKDVYVGTVLKIKCQGWGCRRSFKWECMNANDTPPSYCSEKCRRRRWKASSSDKCPRLDKKLYPNTETAELYCAEKLKEGLWIRPYRCLCGGIHIGKPSYEIVFQPEPVYAESITN